MKFTSDEIRSALYDLEDAFGYVSNYRIGDAHDANTIYEGGRFLLECFNVLIELNWIELIKTRTPVDIVDDCVEVDFKFTQTGLSRYKFYMF